MSCRGAERAKTALIAADAEQPGDLLADLMHLLGEDTFAEALSAAYLHYAYEVNDPDGLSEACEHITEREQP